MDTRSIDYGSYDHRKPSAPVVEKARNSTRRPASRRLWASKAKARQGHPPILSDRFCSTGDTPYPVLLAMSTTVRDAKHKSRFSDQGQGCSGLAGSDTILKCRRLGIEAAFIFRVPTLRTLWGEANGELLIELRNDPQGSSCARWPGMLWVEGLGFMVLRV